MSSFLAEATCRCGLPLRVLTSWTPTNPSRRFAICANRSKPGKKKCGYWEWYDPEIDHDWYRMHFVGNKSSSRVNTAKVLIVSINLLLKGKDIINVDIKF
ncbi:zinc finger C2H2-type/integrase DNA-binding domain-containing protein [Tanacetum coccineum]